jgi:hypothetical protein
VRGSPRRFPRLVTRVKGLGLPITAVVARQNSIRDAVEDSDDVTRGMIGGGFGT